MIDKFKAIKSLCPNARFGVINDEVVWYDEKINQPTDKEIYDKIAELQADYEAKKYQRDRADIYPEIGDQLDMLWHAIDSGTLDKTSDFYTTLKKVKDDNPKP